MLGSAAVNPPLREAPAAAEEAIALDGIEKSYGREPVLRGVTLRIARGEMVSLVGRSGSGKSTLLHVAGGLDRRFRGRARVLGVDLGALPERELARFRNERVGFVFQAFHLLEPLSCMENVQLPDYFARAPVGRGERGAARERALAALDRVGIADLAARLPGELSGGQKQRVAIARALYHAPSLLLADEPTGNLDAETGEHILELFAELHREGLTLLVVTHEERVSRAASRVVRLEDGRIVPDGAGA